LNPLCCLLCLQFTSQLQGSSSAIGCDVAVEECKGLQAQLRQEQQARAEVQHKCQQLQEKLSQQEAAGQEKQQQLSLAQQDRAQLQQLNQQLQGKLAQQEAAAQEQQQQLNLAQQDLAKLQDEHQQLQAKLGEQETAAQGREQVMASRQTATRQALAAAQNDAAQATASKMMFQRICRQLQNGLAQQDATAQRKEQQHQQETAAWQGLCETQGVQVNELSMVNQLQQQTIQDMATTQSWTMQALAAAQTEAAQATAKKQQLERALQQQRARLQGVVLWAHAAIAGVNAAADAVMALGSWLVFHPDSRSGIMAAVASMPQDGSLESIIGQSIWLAADDAGRPYSFSMPQQPAAATPAAAASSSQQQQQPATPAAAASSSTPAAHQLLFLEPATPSHSLDC
jgi:hypothetical protein